MSPSRTRSRAGRCRRTGGRSWSTRSGAGRSRSTCAGDVARELVHSHLALQLRGKWHARELALRGVDDAADARVGDQTRFVREGRGADIRVEEIDVAVAQLVAASLRRRDD